jgi:opacity protein-like surface antigen
MVLSNIGREFIMTGFKTTLVAAAAAFGLVSSAFAADLPVKAPRPLPPPLYSWTGFYGGIFGGASESGNSGLNLTADPGAGNTVNINNGAISSSAYNNLANGGVGQVTNTIIPGGVQCSGYTNCNPTVTPPAVTNITPNSSPGYRTDSTFPTSLNANQLAALGGIEIGARKQFDNNFVVGIGADIMGFTHGGATGYNSTGSFYNTNGFTANSEATGCITAIGAGANTCSQFQLLDTSGSVMTVNNGGSNLKLAINSNSNWLGTVRASAGYAFDRLLIFGSAGLAYSDSPLAVSGSYHDTATSACTGVSNVYSAAGGNTGGTSGQSFVGYQCGIAAVNSASVSQVTTTSVTYSGNHGGILTGYAAGGGMAYAVSEHVAITLEGFYYNLGTEHVTVTGSGSTSTTTTTTGAIGTSAGGVTTGGGVTQVTTSAPATANSFVMSKMIDGAVFKGGIQFKF